MEQIVVKKEPVDNFDGTSTSTHQETPLTSGIAIKQEIKEEIDVSDEFEVKHDFEMKFEAEDEKILDRRCVTNGDKVKEDGSDSDFSEEDDGNFSHNEENDKEQLKCGKCDFFTMEKSSLNRHLKIHDKKSYLKCQFCHYTSARLFNLNAHILSKHREESKIKITSKIHSCTNCSYSSVNKSRYDNHLKVCLKLKDVKWYECDICHRKTIQKSNLIIHKKTHKKSPYKVKKLKCVFCQYQFNRKISLDNHILRKHSEFLNKDNTNLITSKVHECHHCKYKTTITIHLKNHLNGHHVS